MDDVINMLLENSTPAAAQSGPVVAVSSVSKAVETVDITDVSDEPASSKGMTIDLTTGIENDDIQRAVAESLKNQQGILGGQVTREDEEISKVIEQSIAEDSKLGMKRKRGDLWFIDPLNPHERMRENDWPVGLKNVGNTCWFSAVIQSLFHLPVFRQHVLNFVPPSEGSSREGTDRHRNLMFMHELRCLFALMVASRRKYVDPSKAVEILKEAFSSGTSAIGASDSQQDVSEFQHKLLEWLEDAFKTVDSSSESLSSPSEGGSDAESKGRAGNPMVQLFYGRYLAEGINEGNHFENKGMFGQFPLQVEGFKDIHESLEAATAQGEIETLTDDTNIKSGQELWFTRLPPVLTFELSRFQFNAKLARPEKIHKKLDFPERIYMDRYLECNRFITRRKREDAKKLKEDLCELQNRLDKYINYGSGSKRFPLQDVLQCVLEYAESHGSRTGSPKPDVSCPPLDTNQSICDMEMESPQSRCSTSAMESPLRSPPKLDLDSGSAESALPTSPHPTAMDVEEGNPSPRHVSKEELKILQTCLRRWRTEVEDDVRDLQERIARREGQINALYADEALMKCPYRLHAVLVHEGQAVSGHYWAYVFSTKYQKWLKFNDIAVTESSWEEIQKDSVGGFHNTSAYCVMYVDQNFPDLLAEKIGQVDDLGIDSLIPDLLQYVREDNDKFLAEIQTWDAEQRRKNQPTVADTSLMDVEPKPCELFNDLANEGAPHQSTQAQGRKKNLNVQHAFVSAQSTTELLKWVCSMSWFSSRTSEEILDEAFKEKYSKEWTMSEALAKPVRSDPRVADVFDYFLVSGADSDVLRLTFYDNICCKLTMCQSTDPNSGSLNKASNKLRESFKQKPGVWESYQNWHQKYRKFRELVYAFISGVRAYHNQRFSEALPCFVAACLHNEYLTEGGRQQLRGLNSALLAYYRRHCLMNLTEVSVRAFDSDELVEDLFSEMLKLFLPCFMTIVNSSLEKDVQTVEHVRGKWCELLSNDYTEKKRETLQELLAALLDDTKETSSPISQVPQLRDDSLLTDFEQAFDLATANDCIEAALNNM